MTVEHRRIPYGTMNWELIGRECHFVDNTAYIRALENCRTPVFLRPKRFGKSMLLLAVRKSGASVWSNVVPMVVLWLLAVAAVLAYDRCPRVTAAFGLLAHWQAADGWVAAFANRVVFCGIVPGLFLLGVKSIRPARPWLTAFAYSLWGGLWGIACDGFYTLQAAAFGSGTDPMTLVRKTLADQLVWNVFICTPANAIFFPWVARDFRRCAKIAWREFFLRDCLTLLTANWIVWTPVTVAVYAFPLPLQIQLVGLACSFWMLVALRAAAKGRMR